MIRWCREAALVAGKEAVDALRDRRTLAVVLLSSVLMGPLVLLALSALVASLEERAERREVVMAGVANAPTLVNWLQRQTQAVREAPADYEAALRGGALGDPVLVVPADFEARLARGEAAPIELVTDASNRRSEAGAARLQRLLAAFESERQQLGLALRGVPAQALDVLRIEPRELASAQSRSSQVTAMLPFFVLLAMVYGALTAALDSTAGERERGSLEPLLATPAARSALVLGKWAAVFGVAMGVALLSCLSFLPSSAWLRSATLAALFQFGWREAGLFVAALLPLGAAVSALLMAVAIRCRSVKQAQAHASVVLMGASLLPLVALFDLGGEAGWHLWVPALAQNVLMTRVLKGEEWGPAHVAVPLAVCLAITLLALLSVARALRRAALE